MKCKYCGAEFPDWLDFCPECTKPVEEQPAEEAAPLPTPEAEDERPAEPEQEQPAEPDQEPEQEPAPVKQKKKKKSSEPVAEVYQSPERPRKSRRKKNARRGANPFLWFLSGLLFCIAAVAALMLAGVLQLGGSTPAATEQSVVVTEQGYESPEAVLQTYAGALRDGDLSTMLSTYAASAYYSRVPTDADYNTDFDNGNAFRVGFAGQAELQAAGTKLSTALTAEKTRSYLVDAIMLQYTYPLFHGNTCYTYDEENGQSLILLKSEDDLKDYLAQLPKAKPFSEVTLGEVYEVSAKLSEEEAANYQTAVQQVAENCHADAAAYYCIELTIDGEDYILGMELVQYDGLWYNNAPYDYGVVLKDEFANNNFGGLIPVAAIESWR